MYVRVHVEDMVFIFTSHRHMYATFDRWRYKRFAIPTRWGHDGDTMGREGGKGKGKGKEIV